MQRFYIREVLRTVQREIKINTNKFYFISRRRLRDLREREKRHAYKTCSANDFKYKVGWFRIKRCWKIENVGKGLR